MTDQPHMGITELMHEFEIEIPLKHRAKFRELRSISTEKIKRLESALQKCKEQRDEMFELFSNKNYMAITTKCMIEQNNAELESILEGK